MDELKKSVSAIILSEEQTQRIMTNCCLEQKEETMKHRKFFSPKKAIRSFNIHILPQISGFFNSKGDEFKKIEDKFIAIFH